jgi:triacylglycerol lipase
MQQIRLPVVLVPGINDNVGKVAYLAAQLQRAGFETYPISPQPSSGAVEIQVLAEQLSAMIQEQLGNRPIYLFGFSMGGLIGRYYVQKLGGAAHVEKLVTLATPNQGTWMGRVYFNRPACRQMLPNSDFLAGLNRDLSALAQVDYTSIWTRLDLTIVPAHSSWLPVGTMLPIISPVHGWLLRDPLVVRVVVEQFVEAATRAGKKE